MWTILIKYFSKSLRLNSQQIAKTSSQTNWTYLNHCLVGNVRRAEELSGLQHGHLARLLHVAALEQLTVEARLGLGEGHVHACRLLVATSGFVCQAAWLASHAPFLRSRPGIRSVCLLPRLTQQASASPRCLRCSSRSLC